jgi:predicted dehydrogenase
MVPALINDPQTRVVAVASRSAAKAEKFGARFGIAAVAGYRAALERDDVDAVYLPLPSGLHAEWIERALDAGKHVLAEKPLTTDPATTARLVATARKRGLVLRENYVFPHHPQHRAVRDLISSEEFGAVRMLTAVFTVPARPAGDIRLDPALGGGALLDNGGYPIRLAQLLLGPRLTVAGAALRRDRTTGVDTGGAAVLTTPDGACAQLLFGLDQAYWAEYQVVGTRQRVRVDRAFTPPADLRPLVTRYAADGVHPLDLPASDQCANTVRAFVTAVRTRIDDPEQSAAIVRQAELVEAVRVQAGGGR